MSFSLHEVHGTLARWVLEHFALCGNEITPLSVAKFVSSGDEVLVDMIAGLLKDLSSYKLVWLILQHIIENKLYVKLENTLTLEEKIFIRYLIEKYNSMLVEVNFNINEIWCKSGCQVKAN
jgi:hypothetical protein